VCGGPLTFQLASRRSARRRLMAMHISAVAVEASVADSAIAIGPLHQAEQAFDLAAHLGQRDVHPLLLPARLPAARVPAVHHRSDDPGFAQCLRRAPLS
jgi:hypothetical protein